MDQGWSPIAPQHHQQFVDSITESVAHALEVSNAMVRIWKVDEKTNQVTVALLAIPIPDPAANYKPQVLHDVRQLAELLQSQIGDQSSRLYSTSVGLIVADNSTHASWSSVPCFGDAHALQTGTPVHTVQLQQPLRRCFSCNIVHLF